MSPVGQGGGRRAGPALSAEPFQAPSSDCRERQAGGGGGAASGPRLALSTPNTVMNLHAAAPSGPEAAECLVCSELALLVLFSPCQHRTVCEGEWCGAAGSPGGGGRRAPTRPTPRPPPPQSAREE